MWVSFRSNEPLVEAMDRAAKQERLPRAEWIRRKLLDAVSHAKLPKHLQADLEKYGSTTGQRVF
jgi:hypothetical protein